MRITPELVEAYAERAVKDMQFDELVLFAECMVADNLMGCPAEFIGETIREHYPELVDEDDE